MPLQTINPNSTCACCGQPVARERRQALMVDEILLEACNNAFERAGLESSAFVEIAHLVRCLVPHLDERDISARLGMTLRGLDEAARYWLLENARYATGALRTSDDLKALLQQAEAAAKARGRAFVSATDVLDVLRDGAGELVSGRFVSIGARSGSTKRIAAAAASREWSSSTDALELRRDAEEIRTSTGDGWLSTTRQSTRQDRWTAPHAASGVERHTAAAPDRHEQQSYRSAATIVPSIDPRDREIDALTEKLRAQEQQIAQLLAQAREMERERVRTRESTAQHHERDLTRERERNQYWSEQRHHDGAPSVAHRLATGADGIRPRRDADAEERGLHRDAEQDRGAIAQHGARLGSRQWSRRKRLVWTSPRNAPSTHEGWSSFRRRDGAESRAVSRAPLAAVRSFTPHEPSVEFDDLADVPADFSSHEDVTGNADENSKRFYLSLDDPIVRAPSIGQKTAAKLEAFGIWTIRDLLQQDPAVLSAKFDQRFVSAQRIADWQAQSRLVCIIPWLRGTHAQLLVGAGYRQLDQIIDADVGALCAAILRFAATRDGQSVLRAQPPPDAERVARWVQHASLAEASRAA